MKLWQRVRMIKRALTVTKMPRARCPLCGRDVAVTKNGLTFYHRVSPNTENVRHHAVDVRTGKEM